MLISKVNIKKKMVIYLSIIGLLAVGMVILLYKNYQITGKKIPLYEALYGLDSSLNGISDLKNKTVGPASIDTSIFNDKKFQALKDNAIISTEKAAVGKRNPFEPENQ